MNCFVHTAARDAAFDMEQSDVVIRRRERSNNTKVSNSVSADFEIK